MTLDESDLLAARILVVDDQPANVELLAQMLAAEGYTSVSTTTNPREVAPLHRRLPFDLILLDLQMPGMDGFEVMEELKRIEPLGYLPVLVVTAQPSAKLQALQAGAKDFVSKPFDVLEIKTRIRNMLEVRLLYRRIDDDNRLLEQAVAMRTAELRESESRFRALVELASDWYWEQDEHGVFTKVAGPALEMLGLGDEGGERDDAAAPVDAPGATDAGSDVAKEAGASRPRWNAEDRAQLDEKLTLRKPFLDFVYRRVNADGSEQFLQTSGEPRFDETGRFRGYRGIGMDVTARMRAAPTQRQAEVERFRIAMESAPEALFLVDRTTLRYVDVNAAALALCGFSREELLERGPELLSGIPSDQALRTADYDRLIDGGVPGPFAPARLRRKDGTLVDVELQRHAALTADGWLLVERMRAAPAEA
jgi:PAS domain S-box-containing protein